LQSLLYCLEFINERTDSCQVISIYKQLILPSKTRASARTENSSPPKGGNVCAANAYFVDGLGGTFA